MSDYRNLEVWNVVHQFVLNVYKATENFPKEEKYGLAFWLLAAGC